MSRTDLSLSHKDAGGYGVYAKKPFCKGEKVLNFDGKILPKRFIINSNFIQLTEDFALEIKKGIMDNYVNHSCSPNCYIDFVDGMPVLTALREIKPEDEICYNYNTIEYDLKERAFQCKCGSKICLKWIRGYLHLNALQKIQYTLGMLSPYIYELANL